MAFTEISMRVFSQQTVNSSALLSMAESLISHVVTSLNDPVQYFVHE